MRTVTVIGGGWSAGSVAKRPVGLGHVIGVNDAGLLARCDEIVSMDRLWVENRIQRMRELAIPAWLRRAALKNVPDRPDWLTPFENDHTACTPSDDPAILNGTSSGMCALNRAYQLRPDRIVLIGFDMNRSPDGRPYWFAPYPWSKPEGATSGGKYKEWAGQFEVINACCLRAGIQVLNTALTSAIDVFPKVPLESLRP